MLFSLSIVKEGNRIWTEWELLLIVRLLRKFNGKIVIFAWQLDENHLKFTAGAFLRGLVKYKCADRKNIVSLFHTFMKQFGKLLCKPERFMLGNCILKCASIYLKKNKYLLNIVAWHIY